jgi:NAD(P)H dehydrogenase (quinone)
MSKILITGATGQLGGAIINQILTQWTPESICILARNEEKAADFARRGISVRYGSYDDVSSMEKAMSGIDRVMFISSSEFANRLQQHKNVVDAAKSAGVKHIGYTGVAMANVNSSPLKALLGDHASTEQYIKESGMGYTFFRNTLYAEVIPLFLGQAVLEQGVFFGSGDGKVPFALREELGEAIANVLLLEEEESKVYTLTGTELISFRDVANILSEYSGSVVPYQAPGLSEYEAALKSFGLPEEIVGMSVLFSAGIRNTDFEQKEESLSVLLGRTPTPVKQFLKDVYLS